MAPTITIFSEKKLKKIVRINDAVKEYFQTHPGIEKISGTHLMSLFIRKGIFLKNTENGLPVRVILPGKATENKNIPYLVQSCI